MTGFALAHRIVNLVATEYGIPPQILHCSRGRSRSVTEARKVAMYLIRRNSDLSFPEIGSFFLRDHTTVMTACRRAKQLAVAEPKFAATIKRIEEAFHEGQSTESA